MDIEKVVFHALTQFLALAQKEAIQNREVGDLRKSAIKECADKIRTLQKQNEQHKASKLRLYEKYAAAACAWWMPATLIPKRPAARCGGKLYKQSLMRYNIVYGYTLHKIA